MASERISSGVVGASGRYRLPDTAAPGPADLVLAGEPLPLVGALRIYTCGITPYDVTHLGHASTFAWVDLLAGVAKALRVDTEVCRNVTDVDDVLTAAADRAQQPYDEYALTQEFLFERDMADLGIGRPSVTPHARAHVGHVIEVTAALLRLGHAYEHQGTVFFKAPAGIAGELTAEQARAQFAEFGDVDATGRALAGRRGEWDVALWRRSPEEHPAWPSPWGWGRPAWHVECAAMALAEFGSGVDVLVGGADLAFPHHAFQSAIAQAVTGQTPFARRVLHVGTVGYQGSKMAKSTGNLVLVRDLLQRVPAACVRVLLLDRAWSEPWDYDDSLLAAASARLDRVHAAAGRPGGDTASREAVLTALLDDLDVPRALDLACEAGGDAARLAVDILKL